jgi:hypothetical protein
MNNNQNEMLTKILNARGVRKGLRKLADGAVCLMIEEKDGKIVIEFHQRDSGNELMTYGDVAAFLNARLSSVRQMTKARSRKKTGFPAPVNIGGPRIRRSELTEWLRKKQ